MALGAGDLDHGLVQDGCKWCVKGLPWAPGLLPDSLRLPLLTPQRQFDPLASSVHCVVQLV